MLRDAQAHSRSLPIDIYSQLIQQMSRRTLRERKGRKPLVTLCEFSLHVIANSLELRERLSKVSRIQLGLSMLDYVT